MSNPYKNVVSDDALADLSHDQRKAYKKEKTI